MQNTYSVYVIDDDGAVRDSLRLLLSSAGHQVRVFSEGLSFLKESASLGPGLAILDLRMPGACGFDVLINLPGHIRAFLHSGDLSETERSKASELGAIDVLTKPYPPSKLLTKISDAMSGLNSQVEFI